MKIIVILFILLILGSLGSALYFMHDIGIATATRKYAAEYLGRGEIRRARQIVRSTLRIQTALALLPKERRTNVSTPASCSSANAASGTIAAG